MSITGLFNKIRFGDGLSVTDEGQGVIRVDGGGGGGSGTVDWDDVGTGVGGAVLTTKGDLFGYDTGAARVPIGSNGQILTADSTQTLGLKWATATGGGASSPLTTKGDVWGYSTIDARLPVGTNGQVLTADSTQTLGVKWAAGAGSGIPAGGAAGQVLVYGGSSGTAAWAYPPGYQFDYAQITSTVSNATGTPVTAITGNSVTYDGSTTVRVQFSSPYVTTFGGANTECDVHLYEGSTDLGILTLTYDEIGGGQSSNPAGGARMLTPTAGAHTYLIKLARSSGSGTAQIGAGTGTGGAGVPAFMVITKA